MERTIGLGLLGAGTVGGTLVRRLVGESEEIAAKTGLRFDVRRIGVRDLERARDFPVTPGMLTDDPFEVVAELHGKLGLSEIDPSDLARAGGAAITMGAALWAR